MLKGTIVLTLEETVLLVKKYEANIAQLGIKCFKPAPCHMCKHATCASGLLDI